MVMFEAFQQPAAVFTVHGIAGGAFKTKEILDTFIDLAVRLFVHTSWPVSLLFYF